MPIPIANSMESWAPSWVTERRVPAFMKGNGSEPANKDATKELLGDMPAIDVLNLAANEGVDYDKDLNVLYAVSGDLRNVIKTITSLPAQYKQTVRSVLNDIESDVAARNAILLLVAMTADDEAQAADIMIHIWYSAFIRQQDLDFLSDRIVPLICDVNEKIKHRPANRIFKKTWTFVAASIQLAFTKGTWSRLLALTQRPTSLSIERAREIRSAVTMADSRKDFRDRKLMLLPDEHRLSYVRFWKEGILVPFCSALDTFVVPNPTLFASEVWPISETADLLQGWPMQEVMAADGGLRDIHGKLYQYLRTTLRSFRLKVKAQGHKFEIYSMNPSHLQTHGGLEEASFARIETAKMADHNYVMTGPGIVYFGQLLQRPRDNPHATLLLLFARTVPGPNRENLEVEGKKLQKMKRYLHLSEFQFSRLSREKYSVPALKLPKAHALLQDFEPRFNEIVQGLQYESIAARCGLQIKDPHTIVPQWPLRLKLEPGQPGAQQEFDTLMALEFKGSERYVEWKFA